jgi:hypothetical protein
VTSRSCLQVVPATNATASKDFLVIGAYPTTGKYDECTTSEDHERAVKTIPRVALPRVYGKTGSLKANWRRHSLKLPLRRLVGRAILPQPPLDDLRLTPLLSRYRNACEPSRKRRWNGDFANSRKS